MNFCSCGILVLSFLNYYEKLLNKNNVKNNTSKSSNFDNLTVVTYTLIQIIKYTTYFTLISINNIWFQINATKILIHLHPKIYSVAMQICIVKPLDLLLCLQNLNKLGIQ